MITKLHSIIVIALLISGCSGGKISYYKKGDTHKREFLNHVKERNSIRGDYFEVKRNDKGQITSAKYFSSRKSLVERSNYTYTRKGQLLRHQQTEFFVNGPPRISREWHYEKGQVTKREEQWFTRSHTLEKKLTIYYDMNQKAYLEETYGLGHKIESSTEYHYDYKHRLDKSRRNFFLPSGELRDYWLTIYNDEIQIVNEDHYLPDNSLVAFYRYSYHPVKSYREHEEILDEDRSVFISRRYNEFGQLLIEVEKNRQLELIKKTEYEYNDKHQPKLVHIYNKDGKLVKTSKYKKPRILETYRTPGL
ncbi:MAG: hypothetical protein HN995_13390 [Candidatus Marinimicrobia bacterium]|nr:hypothetical protein [Candidatus Neomarinimicrobiota bacterium]MBT3576199.1 hypothetical protein [Candidatus Neomarinimicrobiota bacterium]MBT3679234.1 hypothetical protein [Candidatus Neomarinimicrobiota bacterium]MBT3949728.1 hypothetical protein [Candidatus Neomarinimicrobiota bacterium]MBT4254060.1 hypothetical protein [Candidatus Neomarinimicrobiota bacterium]